MIVLDDEAMNTLPEILMDITEEPGKWQKV